MAIDRRIEPGSPRRSGNVKLSIALALFAGTAVAQTAESPDLHAGDRWSFAVYYTVPSTTPNRIWTITSVTPTRVEATENGEPLVLTRELNVLESPGYTQSNAKGLTFPLAVGKRWRYDTDFLFKAKGSRGATTVDVSVVSHEKVRVPAGEFDAFKLIAKGTLRGTSPIGSRYDAETTETYWYAPSARAIVKSIRHNPYLGTSTVELVDFRLGK